MKNKISQKRGSRIWLPLFFIVPIVFCLLFYVFYIRKPFTQRDKPVFISLRHLGAFKKISGGDSIFSSVPVFKGTLSNGKEFVSEDKIMVLQFVPGLERKTCAMGAANLFRIQKRVSHIKPLKMLSIPDTSGAESLVQRYKSETHAEGNKWDYLYINEEERALLKASLSTICGVPSDSLFTHLFLIDNKGMVRGMYPAESVTEVNTLMNEIIVLNGEYKYKLYHHENSGK